MILPALVKHWPDDAKADHAERSAIVEYEAHRSRKDAEAMAELWIRNRYALKAQP